MPCFPNFCLGQNLPSSGQKVILGISGGVDSAAVAAILKNNGADVICVLLQLFDNPGALQALEDAKAVTHFLGLPLRVIDCRVAFEKEVIQPFVETYCRGETPLPCGLCNPQIKFATLCKIAQEENAQYVATGHYAQIQKHQDVPVLYPATDPHQDQSYFLYGLSNQQLSQAVFPLGSALKTAVRAYAEQIGIPVFKKSDSQDICFLTGSNKSYAGFIENFLKTHPATNAQSALHRGEILNTEGQVMGQHKGIIHYTIGQRHGLGISSPSPLYVLKTEDSSLVVGPKEQLQKQCIRLTNVIFHPFSSFFLKKTEKNPVFCQFRSTMKATSATFEWRGDDSWITFDDMQYGIALGQICVLRDANGAVFGGGVIAQTE